MEAVLGNMPATFASGWFGPDIDLAARDGRKVVLARIVAGFGSAGFLAANFGLAAGGRWLVAYLAAEGCVWLARRSVETGQVGATGGRIAYLCAVALMASVWSLTTVQYWFSPHAGLRTIAILLAAALLIHAQAFAFRSRAVLTVMAGFPAATVIILPVAYGGLSGPALASAIFAIGLILGYVGVSAAANIRAARDLADAQVELESIAYFDALTSVANRRMFTQDIRKLIAFSHRRGTRFALLLIDLDHFKQVNDTAGHDAGDILLVEMATRLRSIIRGSDSLARVGGDEFAILMSDLTDGADVEQFCERVNTVFHAAIEFRGAALQTTSSVGVAIFPDHGADEVAIYKAADVALYEAKRGGRNTWRFFEQVAEA